MNMKDCLRCSESKEISEFGKRANQSDGLDYYCKACKKSMNQEWISKNKEKKASSDKRWRSDNVEHLRAYFAEYRRNLRRSDPSVRLMDNLRKRIGKAIKGQSKSAGTVSMLGCSIKDFMDHLESKFVPGMTWDNYGQWHVDHRIPLASANGNMDRIMELCHYSNLQPLWAIDNFKKSARIEVA